ncbi:hypothetical protein Ddye_011674 [Dipteronia dyeriana]|uniref:Apple domain-containing protein n=1 Tax=Dipteronia dyeriana TaxID=168575 RepID=A0AAD9X343_9ROSI|nr:hypothetical protein Ddye_011674 [Dipteronia dyeriana]
MHWSSVFKIDILLHRSKLSMPPPTNCLKIRPKKQFITLVRGIRTVKLKFIYPNIKLIHLSAELLQNQKENQLALEYFKCNSVPETDEGFAYLQTVDLHVAKSSTGGGGWRRWSQFGLAKNNSTLSFLRLKIDGNLEIYTYYYKVECGAWEVTFNLFSRDSSWEAAECQLPGRCGKFGLYDDNQCIASPPENGTLGWSNRCEAKKLNSCGVKDFQYYKLEGVDHFVSKCTRGNGTVKLEDCAKKCTSDCKCLGYFYYQETSKSWLAYDLMTLTNVSGSTHLRYIKVPNKKLVTEWPSIL